MLNTIEESNIFVKGYLYVYLNETKQNYTIHLTQSIFKLLKLFKNNFCVNLSNHDIIFSQLDYHYKQNNQSIIDIYQLEPCCK